jgi:hypothetical protein
MSSPNTATNVKLISSLFSPEKDLIENVINELEIMFGPTDWISPWLFFDRTRYYEKEMGWPLYRRFMSFRDLIRPEDIVQKKLATNMIEKKYAKEDGSRNINIDPGYITLERLVLATGKNFIHRIYLTHGIYADLTLIFKGKSYIPLEWTYMDYSDPVAIEYFNEVRSRYKGQIEASLKIPRRKA